MDFIRRKLDARSQSAVLILLFFMILGIFAAATGGAILLGCWVDDQLNGEPLLLPQAMDNLALLLGASTLITLFYLLITSGFKLRHLRGGGEQIARILGARHLYPSCREPCEKRAMNVLQEMSIAAGIIPPSLYVLDAEKAINAMAAGTVNNEPAVILTLGAVRLLSRDELAAVISHELGHIINKDTSINAYLTALTSPLEWLSLTGKKLVQIQLENNSDPESVEWGCSSGNRGRLPISTKPVPGLVLVVVAAFTIYWSGVLGLLLARLLKSALSRTREHLADACAVEFTRNPWALASCLKKIAALEHHSYLSDPLAEEFSHFFLADSNKEWLGRWMSTHPPIEERIWQAEPGWDGAIDAISYSDLEQRFAERWGSPQLERQYLLKTTRGHVFTFIAPLFERFAQQIGRAHV